MTNTFYVIDWKYDLGTLLQDLLFPSFSAESLAPPSMSGMDWSSLERKLEQAAEEEARRKVVLNLLSVCLFSEQTIYHVLTFTNRLNRLHSNFTVRKLIWSLYFVVIIVVSHRFSVFSGVRLYTVQ